MSLNTAASIDDTMAASDATAVNGSTTLSSPLERLSVEKLHQQTISMRAILLICYLIDTLLCLRICREQ